MRKEDHIPLIINSALFIPGRKIRSFRVSLKGEPGSLAELASSLSKHNVNIMAVQLSYDINGFQSAFVVADFTGSSDDPGKLLEGLKSRVILDIEYREPLIEGFATDSYHFPIMAWGDRAIIMGRSIIYSCFEGIKEVFGPGTNVMLFQQGDKVGREMVKRVGKFGGVKKRKALEMGLSIGQSFGWFRYEIVEWDEEKPFFVIRFYDNFECSMVKGKKEPNSQFIRGIASGSLSELFEEKLLARETKCISKGDDYCEFEIERV